MGTEAFVLRTRRGASSAVAAEVARLPTATRWGRALVIVLVGTVVGALTIFVPMVHMVSVWGVPLLSVVVAGYTLTLKGHVESVRGPCPACAADVDLGAQGSLSNEAIWVLCPHCKEPLTIAPGEG